MSQPDLSSRGSPTPILDGPGVDSGAAAAEQGAGPVRAPSATPRRGLFRRAGLLGLSLLGALGLVSVFTCTDSALPAGQTGTSNGLCTYPRGCYLVNAGAPNAGECDDCSSTSRCRLVFTPANPSDYQSISGTWMPASGPPVPTDWQAVCGLYMAPTPGKTATCAAPEAVCVARGPACSGYCVHYTTGMGTACLTGVPVPPQRRPVPMGGSTQTYCPLTDDVCCPAATGPDGGAADGGAADGGPVDGGAVD